MSDQDRQVGVDRRGFLLGAVGAAAGVAALASSAAGGRQRRGEPLYKVSLAQWSVHQLLFAGQLDNLNFPAFAREKVGVGGIEFVNAFFKDKAQDRAYLDQLKRRASDAGVECLLIMCDGEGDLGDPDDAKRALAVENHRKWLEAAAFLGCHSIRVNAASRGTFEEQQRLAADGLRKLCEVAEGFDLHVLVENHGGYSSHGAWLAGVMQRVDHPLVGSLPDFGNFCMDWSRAEDPDAWYDRYVGVRELMQWARAVSAKSYEFDAKGNELRTDFARMMKIVTDAGYRGWVGIEWEGKGVGELEGVLLTKRLLERVREELSS